ncbi:MAG: F0F1 ATP synthase subunit A [Rickettsiales bacterium]
MMHSPLEQFNVKPLINLEALGHNISFTNSSLVMVIVSLFIASLLWAATRKINPHPSRMQAFGEMSYNFIVDMVNSTAGPEAKRFIPLIFTLFMFILGCNIAGMIPYSFTVTSHIIVTFALAIVLFVGIIVVGLVRHGLHFFSLFFPKGVPLVLMPLLIVIELISFLARPFTLGIRLAANMMAGHIALKIFAGFTLMGGLLIGPFPFMLLVLMTGFELFVAILQAYIFTILTCVYLTDAIKLH